jgi:hypothetical protein
MGTMLGEEGAEQEALSKWGRTGVQCHMRKRPLKRWQNLTAKGNFAHLGLFSTTPLRW